MTRFPRAPRRPDHWASPHERARTRAAERLFEPLDPVEDVWLTEHLTSCPDCAAVAAAYDADRASLRVLRDHVPEPPRDLWARTAAALEREGAGGAPGGLDRRGWRVPIGALSGIAVIAVVVGATVLSGGFLGGTAPQPIASLDTASPPAGGGSFAAASVEPATPRATPMVVGAGDVRWVRNVDGDLAFQAAGVDEVCSANDGSACATLDAGQSRQLGLASAPKTIISSPDAKQAIAVVTDDQGQERLVVVALEDGDATAAPSAEPSPEVTASESPDAPTATPTSTASPTATASPASSQTPASVPPSGAPSAEPSVEPSGAPSVEPVASPSLTPEPSLAASLVSDVIVEGQSAAFSADGGWFAFTARAADGSTGPDIYVWKVGEEMARPLTSDHASVFASWEGDQVVGSRAVASVTPDGEASAETFRIDPVDGTETALASAIWRPVVAPTGDWAVGWDGALAPVADGSVELTAGSLSLDRFDGEAIAEPEASPAASDAASAEPTEIPAASEAPSAEPTDETGSVIVEGPIADFDARWDETGAWVAVWTADPADPSIGRLSLLHVDPQTGEVDRPDGAPDQAAALPGFSIGVGRLAWATPPGQDGQGSRVQVVAWTDDAVGGVESAPGEDVLIVR